MIRKLTFVMSIMAVLAAVPAHAHELGFAGLLSKGNMEELPEIKLSIGEPLGCVLGLLVAKAGGQEQGFRGLAELRAPAAAVDGSGPMTPSLAHGRSHHKKRPGLGQGAHDPAF